MQRSNLFRCLTILAFAVSAANTFAGGHPPGDWQVPGIRLPQSTYQAPVMDYHVGQKPKLWDPEAPIEKGLTALAQRSWLKFEYLHWNLDRPDARDIGAPVVGRLDPQSIFDNLNGGISAGVGVTPSTNSLGLADTSGIRGTWGLDLANAEMELQFFGTEQNTSVLSFNNISAFRDSDPNFSGNISEGTEARPNILTPLLTNGAPASADSANYLIFDDTYQADISTQMWGAELTLLSKPYMPDNEVAWQWLGGFRYLVYEEEFNHGGTFTNGGTVTPVVTRIGAQTTNNMYGPELGGRLSVRNRWFSLSATPRVAFTLNDYTADTYSGPLAGAADGFTSRVSQNEIDFTPIVQLSLTAEAHVTPNFSLYGGYDFMWIYRMTRPFDNIVYDSTPGDTGGFVPDIRQEIDLESFYARGFSIGCIFRY